jgi:Zn-dependent protease with chaperone function
MNFFNAFLLTLLYSLWQAPLLALLYVLVEKRFSNALPLQKRNAALLLLGTQVLVSLFVFCGLYFYPNVSFYSVELAQQYLGGAYPIIAFYLYCSLLFFKLSKHAYGWYSFKASLANNLQKTPIDIKLFAKRMGQSLGIKREVKLWLTNAITTPLTFGFYKPIILLPASFVTQLPVTAIEAIIIHELTHIKNRDYLYNWFLICVESIYFFNPFLLFICRKVKQQRELSCDVQVLQFNHSGIEYATTLLNLAKQQKIDFNFATAATGVKNSLFNRISFFCNVDILQLQPISKKYLAILPAIFLLFCFIAPGITSKRFNLFSPEINIAASLSKNYAPKVVQNELGLPTVIKLEPVKIIMDKVAVTAKATTEDVIIGKSKPLPIKETAQPIVEQYTEEVEPATYAQFASVNEFRIVDSIKQVTIEMQSAAGKVTQVYHMVLRNGEWIKIPRYASKDMKYDSLLQKLPTIEIVIDSVQ